MDLIKLQSLNICQGGVRRIFEKRKWRSKRDCHFVETGAV